MGSSLVSCWLALRAGLISIDKLRVPCIVPALGLSSRRVNYCETEAQRLFALDGLGLTKRDRF